MVVVTVSFRWWVMPYINIIKFFAWCFVDTEIDVEKLQRKIMDHGIKVRVCA